MGDILVFLTGQDDIDAAVQLLSEESRNGQNQGSLHLFFRHSFDLGKNNSWKLDCFYCTLYKG